MYANDFTLKNTNEIVFRFEQEQSSFTIAENRIQEACPFNPWIRLERIMTAKELVTK